MRFLNFTNGTKSRNAPQMEHWLEMGQREGKRKVNLSFLVLVFHLDDVFRTLEAY